MRRPSSTMTLLADPRSRSVAVSPRRRCGTSSIAMPSFLTVEHVRARRRCRASLGRVMPSARRSDRHRQLAATVDTREHAVLRVELEIEPRAAVRNDAARRTAACRSECVLPRSWSKNTPGRTVQLRDDDALGAVDDEGAVLGHQRHLADVDFLLFHVLDRFFGRRLPCRR